MTAIRLFLSLLLGSAALLGVWLAFGNHFPGWLSIAVCAWLFLGAPVFLILTAQDAKYELDFEDPRGLNGLLLKLFIAGPLGCTGLFLMAAATLVFALFAWETIIEKDLEWLASIRGLAVFGTMFGLGYFLFGIARKRTGPTRLESEAIEKERRDRLQSPDWDFLAAHLDRPVPTSLVTFYISIAIAEEKSPLEIELNPIHPDSVIEGDSLGFPGTLLPFAFDDDREPLFLRPGSDESDVVYGVGLDNGDTVAMPLGDSLESWLRAMTESEDPNDR